MSESPHSGFNSPHGQSFGIVSTHSGAEAGEIAADDMALIDMDECIAALLEAAAGRDHEALGRKVDRMLADLVPMDLIVDRCFPMVAQALGRAWAADDMAFSTVTIGCSRLEAKLHDLDPSHEEEGHLETGVLLLVPENDTHTLGARILALQLRRRRTSVRVLVGERLAVVARVLSEARFDGIFISAAHGNDMKALRDITILIRTANSEPPPIILGGAILWDERFDHTNLLRLTGADFTCDDPDAALRLCGIVENPRAMKQRGSGA